MKFSSALTSVLAASASVVAAAPQSEKRQNTPSYPINGVPGNGVQIRMELRTMQRDNPDMWNLYLLGLRAFMSVPQNDPRSYYAIAGIHGGLARGAWDNSVPNGAPRSGGYCTHMSNIFLTWHRPYLALFEQELYKHVQNAANSFPANTRQRYQNAARNFRMPYWDWAAPPPCSGCLPYPVLISRQYVNIITPTSGGQYQSLLNPLFRYDFQGGAPSQDIIYPPWSSWGVTKRWPTTSDVGSLSQNDVVANSFAAPGGRNSLASRVYDLFTLPNVKFRQFTNSAFTASDMNPDAGSLESVHDTVHSMIGGNNGHMTIVQFSAFDPIFWLHHTNIDRLWTLWSHLNPGSYVDPGNSQQQTFAYPQNARLDVNSPLYPFSRDERRTYWTSATVSNPQTFGYLYPEFQQGGGSQDSVRQAINRLYGPGTRPSRVKRDTDSLDKRGADPNYQYTANIASQKFQLKGSYRVFLFLGDVPADSNKYGTADNMCGLHGVLANTKDATANGPNAMNEALISGSLPLTDALNSAHASGNLTSMDPSVVEPYLQQNLNWRIVQYDGTVVPADQVPGLSVTIVTSEVKPAARDTDFPTWGRFSSMPDVTRGKLGGHVDKLWKFASDKYSVGELISGGMKGKKVAFLS